jgi:hypothetical protein
MATVAISALPATNTVDATTVAPVVYSGSTYKATLTTLGAFINTNAATVSASGNITGGNIRTGGLVSATGNVTGNYILGNGALLTGVITSVANINSGTSNVTVVSSGGNVTVGIGGTSNVAVFATTGEYVTGVVSASGNVTGGNVLTAGLISATSTITSASDISGGNLYSGGEANITGNVVGGNVTTLGLVSSAGNVTGGNLRTAGQVSAAGNITGGNVNAAGLSLSSNVVSAINSTSAINTTGNVLGGNLLTGGAISAASVSASGNVTGGNLNAAGLSLSSNVVSAINSTSAINTTANITGGNIIGTLIATSFSTTGNVTGGNLITGAAVSAASVSASGNVTGGNLNAAGLSLSSNVVSALNVTGAIAGANLTTPGLISATGNITGGNILGGANVNATTHTGATVSVTGNITGGNILGGANVNATTHTGATVSVTGNITAGNLNAAGLSLSSNVVSALNVTSNIAGGNVSGSSLTGNVVSVSGNITGGNIIGTLIATGFSTSGNITGGNLITNGAISAASVSASGNITAANMNVATGNITGGNISLSGNTTPGNVLTGGIVSATGNVTGGNIIGSTAVVVPTVRNTAALTISTSSGNLNLQPTGNIVVNSTYINGVTNPVQDQDVATKKYVDTMSSSGIAFHPSVTVATTTDLATTTGGTVTYTQPNGVGNGIGALLTTTSSFNLIDTANVQTVGTRILVKNQANAVQNGVYTWANSTNIVRSTDTDEYGPDSVEQLSVNDYFFVSSGNVNAGSAFVVNSPTGTITFGTSNITFTTFSSSQTYSGNTSAGISINGTVINAKVDGVTTAFDGSGNISVKTSANLTTPNIGAATGTSLSVTGNITGGNINVSRIVNGTSELAIATNANTTIKVGGDVAAVFSGSLLDLSQLPNYRISATGNISGANVLLSANSRIGVGTTTPDSPVSVLAAGQTVLYPITGNSTALGTDVHISGSDSAITRITQDSFGTSNYPAFTGRSARGNSATPTQTQSNDVLTQFTARGFSSGNLQFGNSSTGRVDIVAAENFTDTSRATKVIVYTTPTGAILPVATATFDSTGAFSATGNVTSGNVLTGGLISATGNVTGGNIITGAAVSAASVSASGNVTGGNLNAAGLSLSSNVVSALNVTGAIAGANVTTPGLVSATGNITGGNIITGAAVSAASVSASGNITGGNVLGGANVNATTHTGATVSVTGNITGGNLSVTSIAGTLTTASQTNITAVGTLTGGTWNANSISTTYTDAKVTSVASRTGAVTLAQADISGLTTGSTPTFAGLTVGTGSVTAGSIVNANANGVGNIGSSSVYFNTVFAKATSAQYADLAEKYTADAEYTSGTVLSFGGTQEVTVTLTDADHRVAGVVSTDPAYVMNAGLASEHVATVALTGRVPCLVTGTVRKGDSMVSAGNGAARAEANPAVSTVIGKALEDFDGESGMIEIVVGRV